MSFHNEDLESSSASPTSSQTSSSGLSQTQGHIERIEVENFKSYKGRQIIGPFTDFTAVIGPNGAGKSNLMDAVSFVLGVRTNHLRGRALRDLVYRAQGHSADTARVSLVFVRNSRSHSSTSSSSTSSSQPQELHFSRSIRSNGTGEYRLNGRVLSATDYNHELEKLDILVKARNFLVFQGDVMSIASKSPVELAALVEKISGADALKERYDELLAEKQTAEENTIFNFEKKKGISAERRQFKEQKEEAERFNDLLSQKNDTQLEYMLFKLYHIEKDLTAHQTSKAEAQVELDDREDRQTRAENQLRDLKRNQSEARKTYLQADRQLAKLRARSEALRPTSIALAEQVTQLEASLKRHQVELTRAQNDRQRHEEELQSLRNTLQEVREAAATYAQAAERQEQEDLFAQLTAAQRKEYVKRKKQAAAQTVELQEQRASLRRQCELERESLATHTQRERELEGRLRDLQTACDELAQRQEKVDNIVTTTMAEIQESEETLEELRVETEHASMQQVKVSEELDTVQERLSEAKADMRESKRDRRFAECLSSLKRLFGGVYGSLTDVCKPRQRRYETAVSVALGRHADSVVVEDDQVAMECVQYMREQRVGSATFIPLRSVRNEVQTDQLRNLSDTAKLATDLLVFEERFEPAVLYACGGTLVCETLDEARRIAFGGRQRQRVVTLSGVLIRKSGFITGGSGSEDRQASRWDHKRVAALKRKREECQTKLIDLAQTLRSETRRQHLEAKLEGLRKRLQHARVDLKLTVEKFTTQNQERKTVKRELQKLIPLREKVQLSLETREETLNTIERDIFKVEDKLFKDFSRKLNIPNIRQLEEKRLQFAEEQTEKTTHFNDHIARLQNQLDYEEHRDLDTLVEELEQEVETTRNDIERLKTEKVKADRALEKLLEQMSRREEESSKARQEADDREEEVKELKRVVTDLRAECTKFHKQVTARETQIDQLRARRYNLYMQARLEEISLPLVGHEDGASQDEEASLVDPASLFTEEEEDADHTPMSSSQASQATRAMHTRQDHLQVDFSRVPKKRRKVREQKAYDKIDSGYRSRLAEIVASLQQLAPNLKAINRFDDVERRLVSTIEDFEAARDRAMQALQTFNEVRQERFDRFMEAYRHVEANIDAIYKQLTSSSSHPGGTAYLTLENPDEPYLHGIKYNAMPPRKRFSDMDQLSGGEKTVAALALLFAIHGYQPSPFFVLDEVDAALDPENVNKVARYIQARSSTFQCIVISLKDSFFSRANSLVGIYRDQDLHCSRTLTLDLASRG
mmetsp:Transcript_15220/g.45620  ORF Transcript_15220/g.45620 Transcript_15220/m.45620 type:complete len:1278 (-) Transcript_15220:184-4017(-)